MTLDVSINSAEADALQQILDRHAGVLDTFERNLLGSVARKMTRAKVGQDGRDDAWRRFVWMP